METSTTISHGQVERDIKRQRRQLKVGKSDRLVLAIQMGYINISGSLPLEFVVACCRVWIRHELRCDTMKGTPEPVQSSWASSLASLQNYRLTTTLRSNLKPSGSAKTGRLKRAAAKVENAASQANGRWHDLDNVVSPQQWL